MINYLQIKNDTGEIEKKILLRANPIESSKKK